ncbi:aldo/keto reductase [Rummeliibacillus stabekisii]|uniref:Oxidoreductase n=1 Tax=Rummeliibacillus stabekisii TaxID=241244 RepID=A0A143HB10_9BACL|nr:aldo/keto reductase [Rummeliibacillus stabekisii]AMW98590.1 oxidoreductase [Rummeliibacillus stabekisii]
MEKRRLGASELLLSEIGLGCMSLPTNRVDASYIVDTAIDAGINYFDTADLYQRGMNEETIGHLLKEKRKDILLATKVGNVWNSSSDSWHFDASAQHIKKAVKESLSRLQTDYIDLYQLHGGTLGENWEEIIDTFNELKQEGFIREYGISSIRPNVFIPFLKESKAVSIMMQYSLLDRRPEEWFDSIKELGASVVTRGSLAKGLLTDDWKNRVQKTNGYLTYSQEELQATLTNLANAAPSVHVTALQSVLQHKEIASAIIGASTREQIAATIQAYNQIDHSNDSNLVELTKLDQYTEHRL